MKYQTKSSERPVHFQASVLLKFPAALWKPLAIQIAAVSHKGRTQPGSGTVAVTYAWGVAGVFCCTKELMFLGLLCPGQTLGFIGMLMVFLKPLPY